MAEQELKKQYTISFGDKNKRELIAKLFSMTNGDIDIFKLGDKNNKVYRDLIDMAKKAKLLDGLDLDNSSIGGNVNPIGGLEESQIEEVLSLTMGLVEKIKADMPQEQSDNLSKIIGLGIPYQTTSEEEKEEFEKLVPLGISIEEKELSEQKENNLDPVPAGVVLADKTEEEKKLEENPEQKDDEIVDKSKEELPEDLNATEKEEEAKVLATFTDEEKKEYILKKYILSGEKLFENIEHTEAFERLPSNDPNIKGLVRDAYLTCSQPSNLMDGRFLDAYVKNHLNIQGDFEGLESLHTAALGNAYVGYHIEEVGTQKAKEEKVAVLSYPAFTDEMPEFIKDLVRSRGKEYIEERIKDVINSNNSYEALAILSPFDDFIDSSLSGLEGQLGSSEEATKMKLYLKEMRSDVKGNIQGGMKNLDVTFDASDVNFKDPDQTISFIRKMRHLDSEAGDLNIDDAIREISSDYHISSIADAQRVVGIKRALESVCPYVTFDLTFGNMSPDERSAAYAYLEANGFHTPVIDNVIGNVTEELISGNDPHRDDTRRIRREITATAANRTATRLGMQVAMNMATNAMAQQVVNTVAPGAAAVATAATVANAAMNAVNPTGQNYDPNDKDTAIDLLSGDANEEIDDVAKELEEEIDASEFDINPENGPKY